MMKVDEEKELNLGPDHNTHLLMYGDDRVEIAYI